MDEKEKSLTKAAMLANAIKETHESETIITIQTVLSIFKNTTEQKSAAQIKNAVIASLNPEGELFGVKNEETVKEQIDEVLKQDRKLGDDSELKYIKGKYQKRKRRQMPAPLMCNTQYLGTAGEYAVMSELLYKGYNVNRMVIDDGLDIIASKNDEYFYIQVKTTIATSGKNPNWQIPIDAFLKFQNSQVRYVFVLRCGAKMIDKNMFFIMTYRDLDIAIKNGAVKQSDTCISVKIRFNDKTNEPFLYDQKESSAQYFLNNFNL